MKIRTFTLLILAVVAVSLSAQKREAAILKTDVIPVIDGVIDEAWDVAEAQMIDQDFTGDAPRVPTLPSSGASGDTWWKMLWDEAGVYVLLNVTDDVFFPNWKDDPAGANDWQYDKPEIYFDVNYDLQDGLGCQGGINEGHYQFAPAITEANMEGVPGILNDNVEYCFLVTDPNWVNEYFIPWERLTDKEGVGVDKTGVIGFDATIIDREPGDEDRKRAVWNNVGAIAEAWANMDDAGLITFDGAEPPTYTETIELTGGTIDENNGMLQIGVVVTPEDASTSLVWSVVGEVGGAPPVKVDADGMVTGVMDGTWTVMGAATDGSYVEATCEVIVTGQIVSRGEINLIRNGYFDDLNDDETPAQWNNWGQTLVSGGVCIIDPNEGANVWDFRLQQNGPWGLNTEDMYSIGFTMWADESDTMNVDFEDAREAVGWLRYGVSGHELSNGRSDWTFQTATEATRYVFDVQFVDLVEESTEQFQFMLGHHDAVTYIDSVEMFNLGDFDKLTPDYIPVETITVTAEGGATTVMVGETLQLMAEVLPMEATLMDVMWMVDTTSAGTATIDEAGVITGVEVGPVKVVAMAKDDSKVYGIGEVVVGGPEGIEEKFVNTLKVYPNPAVNELNVELNLDNSLVTIYNSVGAKMEEVRVSGNHHRFDISEYTAGIYFVKTGELVAKFIK